MKAALLIISAFLLPTTVPAHDFYIAPNARASGHGTREKPYDLGTALSGLVGRPGDTFWLSGGNYMIGHVIARVEGTSEKPITFRPLPGERARIEGTVNFFGSRGYVIVRDLEFYSSDPKRSSAQTNVGFDPTDIKIIPGIASYSPNISFINLIVHDETRHGFYIGQTASNDLIYGCLIFNNGWRAPDNAEGHGIYMQGYDGNREIADNFIFNNSGANVHVYENDRKLRLAGITVDGNVAFNAGAIQKVRFYRDWVVGVDAPALNADRIVFENNMGYSPPKPDQENLVQIGRQGLNGSMVILSNYLPEGMKVNNWTSATVTGNVLGSQTSGCAVAMDGHGCSNAAWDKNTYAIPSDDNGFLIGSKALDFSSWKAKTGFDKNSLQTNQPGNRVFIRPNRYEKGRANIIVYNWDNLPIVPVDVSAVLTLGTPYEVRNAEDFFAAPVLSGVFDGKPLKLPMTGLTVAIPNGPMTTPSPTGPTFNIFVLLPHPSRPQETAGKSNSENF